MITVVGAAVVVGASVGLDIVVGGCVISVVITSNVTLDNVLGVVSVAVVGKDGRMVAGSDEVEETPILVAGEEHE